VTISGAPLFESADVPVDERSEPVTYPAHVSYSSLHLHERCPLSYRLIALLGLGVFREPKSRRASEFGSAFHSVMQAADLGLPAPGSLDAVQMRFGLGVEDRDRLETAVSTFFASPLASRLTSADRVDREAPIRVALGRSALVGNVDALAWIGDRALIIDFKTGEAPSPEAVQRLAGYELQARCYALAAFSAGASAVEAVFCFVEHGAQEVRFEFVPSEADAIKADLDERVERIVAAEATHLPRYDSEVCQWCPGLGGVCPIDPPSGAGD